MDGPHIKVLGAVVAGTLLLPLLAGCDANENADLAAGRQLFVTNCGTCHTLKEAATSTQIGPDLDASFAAARATGMDQDTVEGVVSAQIENPRQTAESSPTYMPPNILEGEDADNVAAYVASVAGVPGIQAPTAPGGPGGQVFADNGCTACHTLGVANSTANVGPNLDDELPGQSPDMIRQSIVDPNAMIVAGFNPDIMPATYGETIDPKALDTLVNFLSTCAGVGSSASPDAEPDYAADGSCGGGGGASSGGGGGASSGGGSK